MCHFFTCLKIMSQSKSDTCTNSQPQTFTNSYFHFINPVQMAMSHIRLLHHQFFHSCCIHIPSLRDRPTNDVHFALHYSLNAPLPLYQHHSPLSISGELQWRENISPTKTKAYNQIHGTKFSMSLPLHIK
jgi:hypothetical protein